MKQLTFAIFLALVIGFTNGDRKISADDFAIDGTSFIGFINAENDQFSDSISAVLNVDATDDYSFPIHFEDISDDGTSANVELAKQMLRCMISRVQAKVNKTIRYQDNRFWNTTFLPAVGANEPLLSIGSSLSALVNLEVENDSKTIAPVQYDPLPGQYYVKIELILQSPPEDAAVMSVLRQITQVVDSGHPDGAQMNILKEVLPQIQKLIGSGEPLRYGRFLYFKALSTDNMPDISQRLQVVAFLEKVSGFCREKYPIPCPYVAINLDRPALVYTLLVTQYAGNGSVVLEHFRKQ